MQWIGLQKFPEGARVRYIGTNPGISLKKGETGTVVGVEVLYGMTPPLVYNVDWDVKDWERHDCDGKARDYHGWNVTENMLEDE